MKEALERPALPLFSPFRAAIWGWPVLVLGLAVAGFFPTYFGRFPQFEGTSAKVHFHVSTMLGWLGLTIAQPVLIARGHREVHRRLGRLSYFFLPVVLAGFWLVMVDGQLRHENPDLILATAFDGFLFFFLVGMGIRHRKNREYHSRFMMLSLLPFLNPTLGRLLRPEVSVPVELLVLIALLIRAHRRQEPKWPYGAALVALLSALATLVLVFSLWPTAGTWLWALVRTW